MCTHITHKILSQGGGMNITLSADSELIRKAREYARRHNSSLNKMIRGYLEKITSEMDFQTAAEEFRSICSEHAGESAPGYYFKREDEYSRHGKV